MGTTLKNAADDTAFISALMALDDFKNKVYTKANEDDNLPNFSTFVTKTELEAPAVVRKILTTNSGEKDGDREITVLEKEVAKKPVAEAVLGVEYTDSDSKTRSVLVEKLGNSLGKTTDTYKAKYDGRNEQIAKDFLAEKSSLVKTDGSNIASSTDKGKALASAILGVEYTDSDSKTRSVLVEKLGKSLGDNTDTYKAKYDGRNEQIAKDFLAEKSSLVKTDGTNVTKELAAAILTIDGDTPDKSVLKEKVTEAPVAGAILGATSDEDGKKSILVEKLGTFLPGTDKVYEGKEAKAFLESKGLGSASADPSAVATELVTNKATALGTAILGVTKKVNNVDKPALETDLVANEALRTAVKGALASDKTFQGNVKIEVNSNKPEFQDAVRGVMSKPFCVIPEGENEPMCCYDPHPTCLLGA